MEHNATHTSLPPIRPLAVWRWGFSIALVGVGLWLIIARPSLAGGEAHVLGWILVGYAVVRLLFSYLMNSRRGVSWKRS